MAIKTLSFTAMESGAARHIEFPLHPQTVSPDQVGSLMTAVLDTITREIGGYSRVSDGDLLQALCMVLAIRMNMVDAGSETLKNLVLLLLEQANEAVAAGTVEQAGRA